MRACQRANVVWPDLALHLLVVHPAARRAYPTVKGGVQNNDLVCVVPSIVTAFYLAEAPNAYLTWPYYVVDPVWQQGLVCDHTCGSKGDTAWKSRIVLTLHRRSLTSSRSSSCGGPSQISPRRVELEAEAVGVVTLKVVLPPPPVGRASTRSCSNSRACSYFPLTSGPAVLGGLYRVLRDPTRLC